MYASIGYKLIAVVAACVGLEGSLASHHQVAEDWK